MAETRHVVLVRLDIVPKSLLGWEGLDLEVRNERPCSRELVLEKT